MSDKEIHNERKAWWEKGKRLVLLTQIGQTIVLLGGLAYAQYVIIEDKVANILSTPKKTALVAARVDTVVHKIDSGFAAYDKLHSKEFLTSAPHGSGLTLKEN